VTGVQLVRQRRGLVGRSLRREDINLLLRAALFVIYPAAVLLHEGGHAVATVALGGHVASFHWELFSGYVVPVGDFSPNQAWLLAAAGPATSVVVGAVLLWLGLGRATVRWGWPRALRLALAMSALVQLVWMLVGYPLVSAGGFSGDYTVIYRFTDTPVLSWISAGVHAGLAGGLAAAWRGRLGARYEELAHLEEPTVKALLAAAQRVPDDPGGHLRLAGELLRRGTYRRAAQEISAAGELIGEAGIVRASRMTALTMNHRARAAVALGKTALGGDGGDARACVAEDSWAGTRVLAALAAAQLAHRQPEAARLTLARIGPTWRDDEQVVALRMALGRSSPGGGG